MDKYNLKDYEESDIKFSASFKEVLEERTRNIEWQVEVKRDGWDMLVVVTATVEVSGKQYAIRFQQDAEKIYTMSEKAGILAEQVFIDLILSWFMRRLESEVFCCTYPHHPKEGNNGKRD